MEPYNSHSDLLQMFRNYLDGNATPEEKRLVETLYDHSEKEPDVIDSYSEQEKRYWKLGWKRISKNTSKPKHQPFL